MFRLRALVLPCLFACLAISCQQADDLTTTAHNGAGGSSTSIQGEPRYLYTVNHASQTLSTFRVTGKEGGLEHLSFVLTGKNPVHVSTSPDGTLVVVCNFGADTAWVYGVDPAHGGLTLRDELQTGVAPVASLFHPSGNYLYIANSGSDGISKFAVDQTTGRVERISQHSNAGIAPQAMTLSKDGKSLYVINSLSESLWTYDVDDTTGELHPVRSLRVGFAPLGIDLHPDGAHLYVVGGIERGFVQGYDLDPQSGSASPMSQGLKSLGLTTIPVSAEVNAAGDTLYVALLSAGEIQVVELAAGTGLPGASQSFDLGEGARPETLLLHSGGIDLIVADGSENELLTLTPWTITPLVPSVTTPVMRTQVMPVAMAYGYGKAAQGLRSDHVFVANSGDGSMSGYTTDNKPVGGTGAASELPGSPIWTGNLPEALALHPLGGFVYAAGRVGISRFVFDQVKDVLEPRPGVLLGNHVDLIMDRRGQFLYAVEGGSSSRLQPYRIGRITGALDQSDLQFLPTGRFSGRGAMDPTGRFLYVPNEGEDSVSNFVVDVDSGQPFPLLRTKTGKGPVAVAVHPTGQWAFVALKQAGRIESFEIAPITGRLRVLDLLFQPTFPLGSRPVDLAVHPSGEWLYVADPLRQEVAVYHIEVLTGALIRVASHKVYKPVQRLAVDASGRFLYLTYDNGSRGSLVSHILDPLTGDLGIASEVLTGQSPRSLVLDRRGN